jgi:D-glycero-alpha-D-manno-heptose-7-phosphate kinase
LLKLPRAVTTITPQRLSFAGGGTDLPDFYRLHGGAVVSSAIDKYIYVTVKRHSPLFNENYRLSYSKTEHVNRLDDIENDIARECLKLVDVDPPLFMATASDLPAASGLGSSSSFAVGLLYALHALRGEDVSAGQLAEEACHIEIDALRHPIGKQDQYAAAFGGLNYITFQADGRVHLDSVWVPGNGAGRLFKHVMLFWTGMQREAGHVLSEQRDNIGRTSATLLEMRDMAAACRDLLLARPDDAAALGALLDSGWRAKRSLASTITTSDIDACYDHALQGGALGGKIAGAGGGGFLFLIVPPDRHDAVRAALPGMVDVPVSYEPRGARLLSVVPG